MLQNSSSKILCSPFLFSSFCLTLEIFPCRIQKISRTVKPCSPFSVTTTTAFIHMKNISLFTSETLKFTNLIFAVISSILVFNQLKTGPFTLFMTRDILVFWVHEGLHAITRSCALFFKSFLCLFSVMFRLGELLLSIFAGHGNCFYNLKWVVTRE